MKRLCVRILASLTALVWCVALSASDGQGTDVDSTLKRFPGYHLLTLQERDPDVKAFVVRHFPKDNPSLVRADFNGDGNPDYAVLLRDDKSGATKLVVLLCSADGQCKSVYELDETAYAGSVYLRPLSMGIKGVPDGGSQWQHSAGEAAFHWNPGHVLRERQSGVALEPETPEDRRSSNRGLGRP